MKRIVLTLTFAAALTASAKIYTFDFHQPATLTPSVAEPAQKESVNLDGRSFTSGPVAITFAAAETGNTHVRIYHSYDAGIDLRLYDDDSMTVSVPEGYAIKSIQFTMSLSGNATGTNDINFIPDTGNFIWEDEQWTPDEGTSPDRVVLTSARQSRIYTMSVDVDEDKTAITEVASNVAPIFYSLSGLRLRRISGKGIYLKVVGDKVTMLVK